MKKQCKLDTCEKAAYRKGWCNAHYMRWRRTGDPLGSKPRKKAAICSVDECNKKIHAHGFCTNHLNRYKRTGSPHGYKTWAKDEPILWLKDMVAKSLTRLDSNCIEWPYAKKCNKTGRGQVTLDGKSMSSARASLVLYSGENPADMYCCHKPIVCHNPSCVNPSHLKWGSAAENSSDKKIDGTENNKLTEQQVIEIFRGCEPQSIVAKKHSVSVATISSIRTGRNWSWLTSRL